MAHMEVTVSTSLPLVLSPSATSPIPANGSHTFLGAQAKPWRSPSKDSRLKSIPEASLYATPSKPLTRRSSPSPTPACRPKQADPLHSLVLMGSAQPSRGSLYPQLLLASPTLGKTQGTGKRCKFFSYMVLSPASGTSGWGWRWFQRRHSWHVQGWKVLKLLFH